jgi:hypothetical protein
MDNIKEFVLFTISNQDATEYKNSSFLGSVNLGAMQLYPLCSTAITLVV